MVEDARAGVAEAVGMNPPDVTFTSGATESNNLALFGLARGIGRPLRVLVCATEHKSVLEACRGLEEDGSSVTIIPVDSDGIISMGRLNELAEGGADVVSVGAANGETGVMQDMREVTNCAHEHGALVHCDAAQAVGRVPFDAGRLDIDMVTFSAHKMYGPKGCGALVAGRDARRKMSCILHGGGQENGLRSGTENVPAIAGFGAACGIMDDLIADASRQRGLRDLFESSIMKRVESAAVNGAGARRLPNTSNMRVNGVLSDALVSRLTRTEIATGSACSTNTPAPSHVLLAMGLGDDEAYESFRVSAGLPSTRDDIEVAVAEIEETVSAIRRVMEAAL